MNRPDPDRIRHLLADLLVERVDRLDVFAEIASTNDFLLEQAGPPPGRIRVALAGHQTAGRGQFDRRWVSPPLSGLCMSAAYAFEPAPAHLPCLTLAAGIATADALTALGVNGVKLKWPNDLIARDLKLGGILTEARAADRRRACVVIGIGINMNLHSSVASRKKHAVPPNAIGIASIADNPPSHSELAATVIRSLSDMIRRFQDGDFAHFRRRWCEFDWLRGREISVDTPDGIVTGSADGIDDQGELCVVTEGGVRRIVSGSVECRLPAAASA